MQNHSYQGDCPFVYSPVPDRSLRLVTGLTDTDGIEK